MFCLRLAALAIGSNCDGGARRKPNANRAATNRQRKSTGALRITGVAPRAFLNPAQSRLTTSNAFCVGDARR